MTEAMPALKKAKHEEFARLLADGLPVIQTYGESLLSRMGAVTM